MKQEPAIRAAHKAYRESRIGEMDALLKERSKWQRRQTIATNKLSELEERIRDLAVRHALILDGMKAYTVEEREVGKWSKQS